MGPPSTLGAYQVRGSVGRGAAGTVYDGWDPARGRRVAIKAMPLPDRAAAREAFRRATEAARRLAHPNIVGLLDAREAGGVGYVVMEFVEGANLQTLFDKQQRFTAERVARIMADVLAGLQHGHERGVVHRDLTPANVLLTIEGRPLIADFGIDPTAMAAAPPALSAYMAPEQVLGEPADSRTNIYAAGVLLYQLLTGERPFAGAPIPTMHDVLHAEPAAPSELPVGVPRAFDAVVQKAMAKRPQDRFATAGEFAKALRTAVAVAAVEAKHKLPAPTPAPQPMAPRRSRLALLVLATVMGLVVLADAGWYVTRPAAPPSQAEVVPPTTAEVQPAPPLPPQKAQPAVSPVPLSPPPPVSEAGVAPARSEPAADPEASPPASLVAQPAPSPTPVVAQTLPEAPAAPSPPQPAPVNAQAAPVPQAEPPPAAVAQAAAEPMAARAEPQPALAPVSAAPTPPAAIAHPVAEPAAAPTQAPPAAPPPGVQPGSFSQAELGLPIPAPPETQAATTEHVAAAMPAALVKQIEDALRGAPCALADAAVGDGGGASVHGVADAATVATLRRQVEAVAGAQSVGWHLQGVDPVFCPLLALLRPISVLAGAAGPAVGLALEGDRTTLPDGEPILPRVIMPDFAGTLRVDYFAHDGTLAHLYPTLAEPAVKLAAQPARRFAAGERLALGDPAPGKPQWDSGAPYGTDIIVAIAASVPLRVAAPRNTEDTAVAYVGALGRAIEQARAAGARVSGALLLVDIEPKPP